MTIPKRINLQFQTLLNAAENHSLCVVESTERQSGKPVYLLCAHTSSTLYPLAQMGQLSTLNHPNQAGMKLI